MFRIRYNQLPVFSALYPQIIYHIQKFIVSTIYFLTGIHTTMELVMIFARFCKKTRSRISLTLKVRGSLKIIRTCQHINLIPRCNTHMFIEENSPLSQDLFMEVPLLLVDMSMLFTKHNRFSCSIIATFSWYSGTFAPLFRVKGTYSYYNVQSGFPQLQDYFRLHYHYW